MPARKFPLVNNEIYHVVLRGIGGVDIFRDETDYYRAIHDLFEFNNTKPATWQYRRFNAEDSRTRTKSDSGNRTVGIIRSPRDYVVNILAFCLMPNHIHLLLKQIKDKGISAFMGKLGSGYVNYFNQRHKRQGHLFQSRFKAVHIKTQQQLQSVFVYVHTNPAALVAENWKEGGVVDLNKIIDFIEKYKWSSYADYLGKENFPSITQREFFLEIMSKEKWREYVNDWVKHKSKRVWDKTIELE